ncbi:MAG: hypothetical protein Q9220_002373 [cf. Caloplaca sp. 1 TL-2023]
MAILGNLIRLTPLTLDNLPSHPALELSVPRLKPRRNSQLSRNESGAPRKTTQRLNGSETDSLDSNGRPNIGPFIKEILDQAVKFSDDTVTHDFTLRSEKSSKPSAAKVQLLKHEITEDQISQIDWINSKIPRRVTDQTVEAKETWFARRSHHVDRQEHGTAVFAEFDHGLRVDHSEHEGEYTPDVFDTYKVLDWAVNDDSSEEESNFAGYRNITMRTKTGTRDFIVVQIPVNIDTLPEAFYSNGRNISEGGSALKRKKPVLGFVIKDPQSPDADLLSSDPSVYTSIERCILRADNQVEWTMATASNARGWLPM